MKNRPYQEWYLLVLLVPFLIVMASCEKLVEDGYRMDYPASDAEFSVQPMDYESGAVGDKISYTLSVNSDHFIKSCVVQATEEGASGSGYDVGTDGFDDPFADHNYGTIKSGVKSFEVKYDYIIPEGINKSRLTFSVIDEKGKVSAEVNITVVQAIKKYPDKSLYAKNNIFNDAFATINGIVYPDIKTNYSTVTEENITVQENIDIIFFYDENGNRSIVCAPDDALIGFELRIENATKFKKMEGITEDDFNNATPASLNALTAADSIAYKGSSRVENIMVGDIIGFTTDINAIHSYKTGLIKINGLHPTNVSHYPGTSFVLECDIITQIDQ
jgi:hypothetical protein